MVREANLNSIQNLISESQLANFLTYGGLVFDLGIVFILLFNKTRLFGVVLVLIFNLTNNSFLFGDIGIFPLFMICSTILFFDSKKVGAFFDSRIGESSGKKKIVAKTQNGISKSHNFKAQEISKKNYNRATILILTFFLIQIVFPFRYLLFNSNPEWYSVGSCFSWRMKMQTRNATEFKMYIKDRQGYKSIDVDFLSFLTLNQKLHILNDPYHFVHLAKYISKQAEERNLFMDPIVTAEIKVEFNGLPAQDMIKPSVDLTRISESPFADNSWICPLNIKK